MARFCKTFDCVGDMTLGLTIHRYLAISNLYLLQGSISPPLQGCIGLEATHGQGRDDFVPLKRDRTGVCEEKSPLRDGHNR